MPQDNDFQTIKFRTKSGETEELQIGELLEIDGMSLSEIVTAANAGEPTPPQDQFLERVIIDNQQQLAKLTRRVTLLEGAPSS